MKNLLYEAGREFLKTFGVSLVVFVPGVLAATNLEQAQAFGVAALFASGAAGLKAIQVFFPRLSFAGLVRQPIAAWLDAFTRASVPVFVATVIAWLNAPDYSNQKAFWVAAIVGAVAAGFRAVEGLLTKGETPLPNVGFNA